MPRTDIGGRKVWNDEGNAHNTRPNSITVQLLANGNVINTLVVSGRGDTWRFSFNNLPARDANGNVISYTVRENSVPGYTTTISGTTITNNLVPRPPERYTNIRGNKTWIDDDNESGQRPNYIVVRLLRNGTVVDQRTVTAANNWQYAFDNVPADDGYGNVYTYTVREDAVRGYLTRINGYNVTNTLLPEEEIFDYATPLAGIPTEEELEDLMDLFDYGTPLWGELLATGDETPIYPFVFGGIGGTALIALAVMMLLNRRKKGRAA